MVGSDAMVSRLTAVAEPVRSELNTASDCAVTVTVSVTEMARTVNSRSVATPRLTSMFSSVCGSKAVPAPP